MPIVPWIRARSYCGGGVIVMIGPFICLYVWALVTQVGRIVVVVRSSGCRCLGDRVSLQLRTTSLSRGAENGAVL